MNCIERADRFAWKWLPGAVHDLRSYTKRVPAPSRCCQVSSPVCCFYFRQFPQGRCANEDPVAFNQSQIRSENDLGSRQRFPHASSRFFIQKPGKDCTGLCIQIHWEPRSSPRSWAAVRLPRRLRGNALYTAASPDAPSVAIPRLAKASSPAGTESSTCLCPGGETSAITSPRSVTSKLSPERTVRIYSLKRSLSSRIPTVFMRYNVAT